MSKNPFRIINRAIKEHLEAGDKLTTSWNLGTDGDGRLTLRQHTATGETCGCPMAMVIDGKKRASTSTSTAAKTLSLPQDWIWSFIDGFDRNHPHIMADVLVKKAYNFGKRLRDKHEALGNVIQ